MRDVLPASVLCTVTEFTACCSWVNMNNMKLNPFKSKEIRVCFSTSDAPALTPLTVDRSCRTLNYLGKPSLKTSSDPFMIIFVS